MKNYLVKVQVSIPYLWDYSYKVEASNPIMAIRKAYKLARQDRLKGKKIKSWNFDVQQI